MVFGTPTQIKQSLKSSGIYDQLVDNIVETTKKNQKPGDSDALPLDRPEVVAAAKTAVTPAFLQSSTEQILDGTYHWLDGKTPAPDFIIDLTPVKDNLSRSLADYAVNRAKGLPTCTLAQLKQLQNSGVDALNVPCLPPGVNPESYRAEVAKSFSKQTEGPFKDLVISADNFQKDESGKTPFQKLEQVPEVFGWVKLSLYILAGIALFSSIALVLLHDDRRRGLRAIGITLLGVGGFLVLWTLLLTYLFAQVNKPDGKLIKVTGDNPFQKPIIAIARSLNNALNQSLFKFCAAYILLGIVILVALKLTGPKKPKSVQGSEESMPTVETGSTNELPPPHAGAEPVKTTEPKK